MYLVFTWMLIFFNKLLVMFIGDWGIEKSMESRNTHSSSRQELISNKLKVQQSCSLFLLRVCNYKLTRSCLQEVVRLQEAYKKWSERHKPLPRGNRFAARYNRIFLNIEEEHQLQNAILQFLEVIVHLNLSGNYWR